MATETKSETTKADNGDNAGQNHGGKDQNKTPEKQTVEKLEFSQDEFTRKMTKEKNQGRRAAFRELGIDPKDEKSITELKALIEKNKTPEQKEVDQKIGESDAVKEAQHRAILAESKVEAMRLGVQPQFVDDAIILVMSKFEDGDDLKTLIGELKVKYPNWFTEDDAPKGKSETIGKNGTGSSMNSNDQKSGDGSQSLGARLAAQRKESVPKASMWK